MALPSCRLHRARRVLAAIPVLAAIGLAAGVAADSQVIDAGRSTIRVFVYKSGLFSAFADDHVIHAPIRSGRLSLEPPLAVDLAIASAALEVLDPKLDPGKRAEVQQRMLGPEVLDAARFPDISFTSTAITSSGPERWTVTGRLTIHGRSTEITFPVVRANGRFTGTVAIRQRDFGIQPISIAGGTVKVKDEVRIQFEIVPGGS